MTLVVPFDGSELAETALVRAVAFDAAFDEGILAVSVIPSGNTTYAREAGWIGADEAFDMKAITEQLHEQISALAPDAEFRYESVSQYASTGTVAKRVRRIARDEGASVVIIGSENAGRLTVSISSVGGTVATDDAYDVLIIRNRSPTKISKLKEASSQRPAVSGFFEK